MDFFDLYLNLVFINLLFAITVFTAYLLSVDKKRLRHKEFIVGSWQRSGHSPSSGEAWHICYTFDKHGFFNITADPPLHTQGRYRILKEIENLVLVELYQMEGDKLVHANHLPVAVDKKANIVRIDERIYRRQLPK